MNSVRKMSKNVHYVRVGGISDTSVADNGVYYSVFAQVWERSPIVYISLERLMNCVCKLVSELPYCARGCFAVNLNIKICLYLCELREVHNNSSDLSFVHSLFPISTQIFY